jgi:hypothetical protein
MADPEPTRFSHPGSSGSESPCDSSVASRAELSDAADQWLENLPSGEVEGCAKRLSDVPLITGSVTVHF